MDGSCEGHYSRMEKHSALKIKEKRDWRKLHNSFVVTSKMEVKRKLSTSYYFSVEMGMYFPYDKDNPCIQICLLPYDIVGEKQLSLS